MEKFSSEISRSALLAAMILGLFASSSENFMSSEEIVSRSSTGVLPSEPDTSMTWISMRHRSMCLRNSWPSPRPSDAPSMRPGMSAMMKPLSPPAETTPRLGSRVVKW